MYRNPENREIPINRDLVGAVSSCTYSVRLKTAPTGVRKCSFIVDLRINGTLQIPTGRVPFRLSRFYRGGSRYIGRCSMNRDLVGAVSSCTYSVRLQTAPTGVRECSFIVDLRINGTLQIPTGRVVPPVPILSGRIPIYREMLDESAPVRLKTAPTGVRKCSFIF